MVTDHRPELAALVAQFNALVGGGCGGGCTTGGTGAGLGLAGALALWTRRRTRPPGGDPFRSAVD